MQFEDKRPQKPARIQITADMVAGPVESLSDLLRREIRKYDDACFDEIAAVILSYYPDIECTGPILRARLTELLADQERLHTSDCPTCGNANTCHHNRGAHGVGRINCPLWRPTK